MRVALIQAQLEPKSRARNLQRLIAAIDRVAGCTPAPDVLVLPGSCDTGGAALHRYWTEACAETACATLAWKAREWGVYIVAGLHRRREEQWRTYAALFDPDGDIVARSGELHPAVPHPSMIGKDDALGIATWTTPHGDITVLDPVCFTSSLEIKARPDCLALLAIPVPVVHRADDRKSLEENLKALHEGTVGDRMYVCVASPVTAEMSAGGPRGASTYLRGPGGALVATAKEAMGDVVMTEIPLKAVA